MYSEPTPIGLQMNGQSNAENVNNQSPSKQTSGETLVDRIPVKNTIFSIIGTQQNGYFIAVGKYRVSKGGLTKKKCQELIDQKDWELIFALMGIAIEQTEEIKHQHEETDTIESLRDKYNLGNNTPKQSILRRTIQYLRQTLHRSRTS